MTGFFTIEVYKKLFLFAFLLGGGVVVLGKTIRNDEKNVGKKKKKTKFFILCVLKKERGALD